MSQVRGNALFAILKILTKLKRKCCLVCVCLRANFSRVEQLHWQRRLLNPPALYLRTHCLSAGLLLSSPIQCPRLSSSPFSLIRPISKNHNKSALCVVELILTRHNHSRNRDQNQLKSKRKSRRTLRLMDRRETDSRKWRLGSRGIETNIPLTLQMINIPTLGREIFGAAYYS